MSTSICIIPARGGSTRIPGKNTKDFFGVPMLVRAIRTAQATKVFQDIAVSTDDPATKEMALKNGAKVLDRLPEYAENSMGTQKVMQQALNHLANLPMGQEAIYDFACCLYPCTPLLLPDDLRVALGGLQAHPWMAYAMSVGTEPLADAGGFYFGQTKAFRHDWPLYASHTMMLPLPPGRTCDVNTPEDFARCEQLFKELHK